MPSLADAFRRGPAPVRPEHCFAEPGWHVWCGSLVRDDAGRWHLFYSRWPEAAGFEAWVTHSEIARAEAASPEGPFVPAGPVLRREAGGAWDAHVFHNVTVHRFGGRYYLYYMGNRGNGEWWDHRNRQRIGVAVADRPEGPWRRLPAPVLDVTPGAWDALMVSNPAVAAAGDGRFLMVYKGVGAGPMPFGGRVLHGLAWAAAPEGPFVKRPAPILDRPGVPFAFEDPFVWRADGGFAGLVKDMEGVLSPRRESGLLHLRSPDGAAWEPGDPLLVLGRSLRLASGEVRAFARVERPQLAFLDGGGACLLVAVKPLGDGPAFSVRLFYV